MTPENFAYWLQGFFELTESKELTSEQIQMIKEHLALVFTKVTPITNPSELKDRAKWEMKPFENQSPESIDKLLKLGSRIYC